MAFLPSGTAGGKHRKRFGVLAIANSKSNDEEGFSVPLVLRALRFYNLRSSVAVYSRRGNPRKVFRLSLSSYA